MRKKPPLRPLDPADLRVEVRLGAVALARLLEAQQATEPSGTLAAATGAPPPAVEPAAAAVSAGPAPRKSKPKSSGGHRGSRAA